MTQRLRPTWLEIDLGVIARNTQMLRARTTPGAQLMAVVKADAYGHGAAEVSGTALQNGAQALGVALAEEGVQLREAGIDAPILVFGGVTQAGAQAVARHGLAQVVYDEQAVRWLSQAAQSMGRPVRVHLKADSGMGRVGVRGMAPLMALADAVASAPGLSLAGLMTHFATADEADTAYAQVQHACFLPMVAALRKRAPHLIAHAANSAALLRMADTHHNLARPGIALYTDPHLPGGASAGLAQAMRWVTHGLFVKVIAPGEPVGYGRAFTAARPTRVMTVPVGYGDGYHLRIGGTGFALVRGQKAPVIGRVCMDQAMLDVTGIAQAAAGDEVVLLGRQGDLFIDAADMGDWCDMIPYEILLSPTARVPRVYIG